MSTHTSVTAEIEPNPGLKEIRRILLMHGTDE